MVINFPRLSNRVIEKKKKGRRKGKRKSVPSVEPIENVEFVSNEEEII